MTMLLLLLLLMMMLMLMLKMYWLVVVKYREVAAGAVCTVCNRSGIRAGNVIANVTMVML